MFKRNGESVCVPYGAGREGPDVERPLRMGSYLRLSGFFPQVSYRTSFFKELGTKVGIVTLRVIVGMRKGSIKRQNTESNGNCLAGIDIPSSCCVKAPLVLKSPQFCPVMLPLRRNRTSDCGPSLL